MGVTWLTESPRDWRSSVATGFFVLLVVLLRIAAPPVVWIDATVTSRPTAERNRSDRNGRMPWALQRIGSGLLPGRRHDSRMAFVDGPHEVKEGKRSSERTGPRRAASRAHAPTADRGIMGQSMRWRRNISTKNGRTALRERE